MAERSFHQARVVRSSLPLGWSGNTYNAKCRCISYVSLQHKEKYMEDEGIIDLGDLRVIPYKASPENSINSIQDFLKLDMRINRGLTYYDLRRIPINLPKTTVWESLYTNNTIL
jgi:hypothetical protein